jgi:formylglycine-generating enzyme required for sulfatase activity
LANSNPRWFREAVENGDADFGKIDQDPDLDTIPDDPAFAVMMKRGHPDRRYSSVWNTDANFEATPVYGLDPTAHLRSCRELIAQGFRPVSWSVSPTSRGGLLATASVWHRPVVQKETKDRLAERQARAAIALVRMGKAEEVWHLLRHSADPRLRSFIVNWLNPLGADPKLITVELDHIDANVKPIPAQGQQRMDAILFHTETSMRRALILALGTYGTEGLSPGEREPLIRKLAHLYYNDPDSGVHGAAEWTLRNWGQQAKLKDMDAQLQNLKEWGERRWYVNGQGQTFALIEGPVEFRMGSPPTDMDKLPATEPLRWTTIPRRFAISTTEVTVEQNQRLTKTNSGFGVPPSFFDRATPDPGGPTIAGPWYAAVAYCNWLSEQERLPKDHWCYLPNERGAYAERMTTPANVLERIGYRLPTEAEWECACRAGTVTCRYYGLSIDLLDAYAWYQANSKNRAGRCGSLLPNDLELFDMLGNMYEWVNDQPSPSRRRVGLVLEDTITFSEYVLNRHSRVLRGGTFRYPAGEIRSSNLNWYAPLNWDICFGFRPARTYH